MPISYSTRRNKLRSDGTTLYGRLADTVNKMDTASLVNHEFGVTFHRNVDEDGKFIGYVSEGRKFSVNIVAEVGSEEEGTWLAAYPKKLPANKLVSLLDAR